MVKFFRFTTEHTVSFILQPWQFCFLILASWVHSEQQKIIEFYQAELEAVMKAQGKKRLLLSDDQRRLLRSLASVIFTYRSKCTSRSPHESAEAASADAPEKRRSELPGRFFLTPRAIPTNAMQVKG
jgi:hypothetical protein